jgi:hypothetical protein
MSWLGDIFKGARPDMQLPGYATDFMNELRNYQPGIGGAAKAGKRLFKQYENDPESLATQSLNAGAVQRATAGEDYASGANALIGQYGNGEQQNLTQRMKEGAIDRINTNQGIQAQQEAQSKGFGGLSMWQQGIQDRNAGQNQRFGIMGNVLGAGYDRTRRGGLFSPDTIGGAVKAFAGGVGQGIGAGARGGAGG